MEENVPKSIEDLLIPVEESQNKSGGRLTVVDQVYHEANCCEDTRPHIDTRFSLPTYSDDLRGDQLYRRVRLDWEKIDYGEVTPSMVVIQNVTGRSLRTHPTKEVKDQIENCRLEIGVSNPERDHDIVSFAYIPSPRLVGRRPVSIRLWPIDQLWIRVNLIPDNVTPEYNLFVIPE